MTQKKETKTDSKPKTAIAKTTKPAAKALAKTPPKLKAPAKAAKKESSVLIKTAETVGGILGRVAGTAHNAMEAIAPAKKTKKAAKITDSEETGAEVKALPESTGKSVAKPKTTTKKIK